MDNIKVGKFIAELRKENSMTQKQLANILGVTDKAVSKWERGIGYPDISLLQELSRALGVNVNELLAGSRDKMNIGANTSKINDIILDAIHYSDSVKANKKLKKNGYILGIIFLIAMLVCSICNIAINKKITWAYYPIGGLIVTWLTVIPHFFVRKYKWLYSLLGFYIASIPYLFIIEYLSNTKGWVTSLAVPIVTIGVVYILVIVMMFMKLHISKWYISSLSMTLFIAIDYIINRIIESYINQNQSTVFKVSIEIFVTILLLIIGLYKNSMKATKDRVH
ncbi:helix-turn-helix domain-containing protein [Clostridiaceae bacterium M8S5]|nr:helix-turn-helix domain-containing protein [Clostridiaceae bacterium M8S5]